MFAPDPSQIEYKTRIVECWPSAEDIDITNLILEDASVQTLSCLEVRDVPITFSLKKLKVTKLS